MLSRVRQQLKNKNFAAFFVTKPENIYYLSGFRGSFGYLLITPRQIFLITDFRYLLQAKKQLRPGIKVLAITDWPRVMKKVGKIGFEGQHLTIEQLRLLRKKFPGIKWQATKNLVEAQRQIKTPAEIRRIKKAARIAVRVYRALKAIIKPGVTEITVAGWIECLIKRYGGEASSFPPIVAFGVNAALPHHAPGKRKVRRGEMILIDFGASYQGYFSDITRMIFQKKPTNLQQKILHLVSAAQKKAIQAVRPGMKVHELDQIARACIKEHGYDRYFGHGLGHGVGLEIHEAPAVNWRSKEVLKPGMVITIEPGIYLPGKFGIRLEEMVLVKESGAQVLSLS